MENNEALSVFQDELVARDKVATGFLTLDDVRYEDGFIATVNGRPRFSTEATDQLRTRLGVPLFFVDSCSPELRSAIYKERLQQKSAAVGNLRCFGDDQVETTMSGKLLYGRSLDVFLRIKEELSTGISSDVILGDTLVNQGSVSFSLLSQNEVEARKGDNVKFGVSCVYFDRSDPSFQYSVQAYRLVCKNGATQKQSARVSRMAEKADFDGMLSRLTLLTQQAAVVINSNSARVKRLAEETVADPIALVKAMLRSGGVSQKEIQEDTVKFLEGDSRWDVVNAITAQANNALLTPALRDRLQQIGGASIFDEGGCPVCHRIFADAFCEG